MGRAEPGETPLWIPSRARASMHTTDESHEARWLEAERQLAAQWIDIGYRPQPSRPPINIDLSNINPAVTMFDPSH